MVDVKAIDDLDPWGTPITDGAEIAQQALHRLSTQKGSLLEDATYGEDIISYMGIKSADAEATLVAAATAEVIREDGCEGAVCTLIGEVLDVNLGDFSISVPLTREALEAPALFDPGTLPLSWYLLGGDYTGGTWVGRGSLGGSGSKALTYYVPGGAPPTTLSPSGVNVPNIGVTSAQGFTGGTLSSWLNANTGTLVFGVKINSSSSDLGTNLDALLFGDTAGFSALAVRSIGPALRANLDVGSPPSFVVGGWNRISLRWDLTTSKYQVRLNGGAWVDVAKTVALTLTGNVYLGFNPVNGNRIHAALGAIFASYDALSDTDVGNLETFCSSYLGI